MSSNDPLDDDEDDTGAEYENGRWDWDIHNETLVFIK